MCMNLIIIVLIVLLIQLTMSSSFNDKKYKKLKEKIFKIRNSPLTDKYENSEDIRTIYNFFTITLLTLSINTFIIDYFENGRINFGQRLLTLGFNNIHIVILSWGCLYILYNLTYVCLFIWRKIRICVLNTKYFRFIHTWDKIYMIGIFTGYIASFYFVNKIIVLAKFYPGSSAIIVLEHIRLLMKSYAFLRSNLPIILNYKINNEEPLNFPTFQKFLYFSFAPTLVYKNKYPRTDCIRWKFVLKNIYEFIGILFFLSLVIERFLIPPFESFGLRKYSYKEIILPIIGNLFPGIIFLFAGFYSVIHITQNIFAELLRFGDRMFYKVWWTSKSFSEFYRTWNIVIHDWLYTYIYKDMYELIVPNNKGIASFTVFTVSAIVHEWIMIIVLRIFFPVHFFQFFMGGATLALLNILNLRLGNYLVIYMIVLGSGIQVNLLTLELFAKNNCPESQSNWEYFTPHFFRCNSIE